MENIVKQARNAQLIQIGQKPIYASMGAYNQPMQNVQTMQAYNASYGKALIASSSGTRSFATPVRVPTSLKINTTKQILSKGGIALV